MYVHYSIFREASSSVVNTLGMPSVLIQNSPDVDFCTGKTHDGTDVYHKFRFHINPPSAEGYRENDICGNAQEIDQKNEEIGAALTIYAGDDGRRTKPPPKPLQVLWARDGWYITRNFYCTKARARMQPLNYEKAKLDRVNPVFGRAEEAPIFPSMMAASPVPKFRKQMMVSEESGARGEPADGNANGADVNGNNQPEKPVDQRVEEPVE